jgi:hypothetical protein
MSGPTTVISGYRPPDEKWLKMRAVFEACEEAGIEPPREVSEFFQWRTPDDNGIEVEIASREYQADMCDIWEVKVADIPSDITVIRFTNSY